MVKRWLAIVRSTGKGAARAPCLNQDLALSSNVIRRISKFRVAPMLTDAIVLFCRGKRGSSSACHATLSRPVS